MIKSAGVVVPAHNEQELLPACLQAIRTAAGQVAVPVHIVVVADACDDATAQRARRGGATVVAVRERNVGRARGTGMRAALARLHRCDPADIWLATTDADSLVPPDWLVRQLGYGDQGFDAVVGTVTVQDWSEHPPELPALFLARYGLDRRAAGGRGGHPHVHGANLGFTGRAYLLAGGFGPECTAEDHALVAALVAAGCRILRTADVSVVTSARRHARAPAGFSGLLASLATPQ